MGYVFVWVLLSFVIGRIGLKRKIGYLWAMLISLLLSPVLGLIITLFSPQLSRIEYKKLMLEEQRETNALLKKRSTVDELKALQELRSTNVVSEAEYEKLKGQIINA